MLLLALLLGQASMTLGETAGLSAPKLGDRILAEHPHRLIEQVEQLPTLPGEAELQLTERAEAIPRGCTRQRWIADFLDVPGMIEADRKLVNLYPLGQEISRSGPPCSATGYTYLNPGISINEGYAALDRFDRLLETDLPDGVTCSDSTKSGICKTKAAMKRALGLMHRDIVTDGGMTVTGWNGAGDAQIEVHFRPSGHVAIFSHVAPPF